MNGDIISFGIVKNTYDPSGAGMVQVRIAGDDDKYTDEELAWAFPLLPKILHVRPKLGETVMIINRLIDNNSSGRYYIGPVISQPQAMYEESITQNALRTLQGTRIGPLPHPEIEADRVGTLPDYEDIAILGRKDSDIILKDDDIRIRCGVKKTNSMDKTDFTFNPVHPAFIKMKHVTDDKVKDLGYESVINLVADKINFIGSDSRDKFNIDDKEELISDEEVNRFINEAHQVPFGDKLIEFLRIFITAFQSHTHAFVGNSKTPCKDATYKALADYNLESMLSTTMRIN